VRKKYVQSRTQGSHPFLENYTTGSKDCIRGKTVTEGQIIEQMVNFNNLGYLVACSKEVNVNIKLYRFQNICNTARKALLVKYRSKLLEFYKVMAVPNLLYGS
jgi:hypothetical protein